SAGGAGGAGDITLDLDGSLYAQGAEGVGVFAQSAGTGQQGNIGLTLQGGHVLSGGAGGTAVWFSGGAANTIANHGVVTTADGAAGTAVLADDGTTAIDNFGTMVGEVRLAAGANSFANHEDAAFAPGAIVDLGAAGSLLANDGAVLPGSIGHAQ